MFNVFTWLRSAAKNAVMGGVGDALTELAGDDPSRPVTLADLQQRLQLGAPAPPVEDSVEPGRKPAKAK